MARQQEDLGERKHARIDLHKTGYLIPAPDAPWIECTIIDVSANAPASMSAAWAVPKIFGLAFTGGGEVLRVGLLIWRQGERLGAPSVTAKELRQGLQPDRGRIDQD
jgi:hypothetical protein